MSDDANKTMLGISPFRDPSDESGASDVTPPADAETPAAAPRAQDSASRAASSVEEHIRSRRKELALKTQRLNLDELDWDVDPRNLSTPAAESEPERPAETAASTGETAPDKAAEPEPEPPVGGGTLIFGADAMARIRGAARRLDTDALPPPPVSGEHEIAASEEEPAAARAKTTTQPGARAIVADDLEEGDAPTAEEAAEEAAPVAGGTMIFAAQSVQDMVQKAGELEASASGEDAGSSSPRHGASGEELSGARTEMPAGLRKPASDEAGPEPRVETADAPVVPGPSNIGPTADRPAEASAVDTPTVASQPITRRRQPNRGSNAGLVLTAAVFVLALVAVGLFLLLR